VEGEAVDPIPEETLRAVEQNLHAVIRGRAAPLIDKYAIPLPSLAAMLAGEVTTEFGPAYGWTDAWFFSIPGMYGGFRLRWIEGGPNARLEAVGFCRVVGGSGQLHEITAKGSVLVESGMF
jgi:hypothetical protein